MPGALILLLPLHSADNRLTAVVSCPAGGLLVAKFQGISIEIIAANRLEGSSNQTHFRDPRTRRATLFPSEGERAP